VGGDCGYRRTGFAMVTGEQHAAALEANVAAVIAAGGRSQRVDPADLADRHPALRFAEPVVAAYEEDGGYADPIMATTSLLAASGARCAEGAVVHALSTRGDAVSGVETNLGRFEAPLVVLAGGAWAAKLAASVGVEVPVAPKRIGIARLDARLAPGDACVVIDDTTGGYFRPTTRGSVYVGVPCDPDAGLEAPPAPLTGSEIAGALRAVRERLPVAGTGQVDSARAGLDGYTPDKRPAIGAAGPDGCYLAVGFSGGGVKIAPAVGELVAAELTGAGPQSLLEPYRPGRFAAGALIESEHPYDRI
jgi:glycine/D-amino acid oxidase-like deaminating enzyme